MIINRENLLRTLESVSPGLGTKETVQQSGCFIFQRGCVQTFNGEVACIMDCDIGVEGAVSAAPLLQLLGKFTETDVNIEEDGNQILVKGKRRRAGIAMESEILLPVDRIELPEEWRTLHPEFIDAISIVKNCAGNNKDQFCFMCVHVTPDFVEASDNFRVARYPLETGLEECLIKRDNIKYLDALGMVEVSESETWIHFQNKNGLMLSTRRVLLDFPDVSGALDMEGHRFEIPGGMEEAIEKAEVFTQHSEKDGLIDVTLEPGKITLKGVGLLGWFAERKKVKYDGEKFEFMIAPKMLQDICKRTTDCYVSEDKLRIDGGKFTYVSCLQQSEK